MKTFTQTTYLCVQIKSPRRQHILVEIRGTLIKKTKTKNQNKTKNPHKNPYLTTQIQTSSIYTKNIRQNRKPIKMLKYSRQSKKKVIIPYAQ